MKFIKVTILTILIQSSFSFAGGVSGYVNSTLQMYPGASLGVYAAEGENGLTAQAAIFCKKEKSTVLSISNPVIQVVGSFVVETKPRNAHSTFTHDYPYINSTAFVVCK